MPFPNNAAIPAAVRKRFSDDCLTVWRKVWNTTFDEHHDEGRAFATAEKAATSCASAAKATEEEGVEKGAVKFAAGSDSIIEGIAIPFGAKQRDIDGDYFESDTEFCFDWFPEEGRPFLYHHGFDPAAKLVPFGRQITKDLTDEGVWAQVQLDTRAKYVEQLQQLVQEGALGFSSGSVERLFSKKSDGKITRWPWIEQSATPTPAWPNAVTYASKATHALEHLLAVETPIPEPLTTAIDDRLEASLAGLSFADHSDRVLDAVKAFVERSQEIAHLRAKSGRVLSEANRARLRRHLEAMNGMAKDLASMLTDTDPEAAQKQAIVREVLRYERERARQLGVTVT